MKFSIYDFAGISLTMLLAIYLLEFGIKPNELVFWILILVPITNFFLGRIDERLSK